MSKLVAAKTLFEIGKIAADTYTSYINGKKTNKDISKDREIQILKEENEKLKKQIQELKEEKEKPKKVKKNGP